MGGLLNPWGMFGSDDPTNQTNDPYGSGLLSGVPGNQKWALALSSISDGLNRLANRPAQSMDSTSQLMQSMAAMQQRQQALNQQTQRNRLMFGNDTGTATVDPKTGKPTYGGYVGTLDPSVQPLMMADPTDAMKAIIDSKMKDKEDKAPDVQQNAKFLFPNDPVKQQAYVNRVTTESKTNINVNSGGDHTQIVTGMDGKPYLVNKVTGQSTAVNLPGGSDATVVQPGQQPLIGDAFLKTLPPDQQNVVKAYSEGRLSFPVGRGMTSPAMQRTIALVSQYDPTFDATNYNMRSKTRNAFTSGNESKTLNYLNTAMEHAGRLSDNLEKLNNYGGVLTPLNASKNYLSGAMGNPAPTVANEDVSALASEARKVYAATGGGNLTELENWERNFPVNGSPEQQKGALKEFAGLIQGKIDALNSQYSQGMGKSIPYFETVHPKAAAIYHKLLGDTDQTDSTSVSGNLSDPLGIRR